MDNYLSAKSQALLRQEILAANGNEVFCIGRTDAEQIIACAYSDETIKLDTGSIDAPYMQEKIVTIMEGGEEAFNLRKRIYEIWKPQSS